VPPVKVKAVLPVNKRDLKLTKAEIVNIVAQGTGLTKLETQAVIDGFIATIIDALKRGESVEIRGLGRFQVVEREARRGRNPQTGEEMTIPRRKVPVFRISRDLRRTIKEA